MEENPWIGINLNSTDRKFVLEDDKQLVDTNNDILGNDQLDDAFIDLNYFPEPFIGKKNAGIYFLLANPGRSNNDDPSSHLTEEQKTILKDSIQKNLQHSEQEIPFYILNPAFVGTSGYNWWKRCLDPLVSCLGIDDEVLNNNIFNLELYGYHSFRVNSYLLRNNLSSLAYTKSLVVSAIEDQKLILIGRSVRNWFNLVPALRNYENCFFVANERKMILSEMTLSPHIIQKIRDILGQH